MDDSESKQPGTLARHFHTCLTSPACQPKLLGFRYRPINGVCNNSKLGAWGAAHQPMERLIPLVYEDVA